MITTAYDKEHLVFLCVVATSPTPDADYERAVTGLERLGADGLSGDRLCTNIVVVDRDHDLPAASWRRRLADAEKQCHRLRMLLVTESAAARGVITALQWLTGSGGALRRTTHATLAEAVATLEGETGHPLPVIQALHETARAEMAARGTPQGARRASSGRR